MIRVEIAQKNFGDVPVLHQIDLKIEAGECVALLGPSGIGKSTLMRIAAGLDKDFLGQVHCPAPAAMVFQEPNLLPWRGAFDNLALFHPQLPRDAVEAMLVRVGLEGKNEAFPSQLSLGQQRRLALARAFAGTPKALFLDEPFVSLDAELAADMLCLTQELIAETRPAVLFITHAAQEAAILASRSVMLSGAPARLLDTQPQKKETQPCKDMPAMSLPLR